MNLASIDIGTNAVLLLIMKKNGEILKELLDVSTITRLGEGLIKTGRLSFEAIERTLRTLERYGVIMAAHDARPAGCFGTSALREAENSGQFIRMAREAAGMEVKVLSEREEACYTYLSVARDRSIPGQNLIVVDIGGGSTEIARGSREGLNDYVSLSIGTVKLTEQFIRHDPPLEEELNRLSRFIRDRVAVARQEVLCKTEQGDIAESVIGVGGTMTTLAALVLRLADFDKEKIDGLFISRGELEDWIALLTGMQVIERKRIAGMEPGREDLLLQGIILMKEVLNSFQAEGVTVSTRGARHGVLYETAKNVKC
jgi:exopolyphosphatase/guanosine-5'-triphosphate,3'-diphosphate pyrophosphatase